MMPILSVVVSAAEVVAAVIAPQERKTSVAVAAISPRSAADGFALVADGYRIVMVWIPPLVSSRRNGRLILARHRERRWDHRCSTEFARDASPVLERLSCLAPDYPAPHQCAESRRPPGHRGRRAGDQTRSEAH